MGTVQDEGSYFLLYQYLKYMHHTQPTSVSKDMMKEIFQDYGGKWTRCNYLFYENSAAEYGWDHEMDAVLIVFH